MPDPSRISASLSTHVLNLDEGAPVAGMTVELRKTHEPGQPLATAETDSDGRGSDWPALDEGIYELTFNVGAWFEAQALECFYPRIRIEFHVSEQRHYHVPLLLNRFGFSSYRGS